MGQLIGKSGTLAGKKYELHSDKESSLGRSPDNTIVVDEQAVSRKHFVIEQTGDEYFITDYSRNGTYLNDQQIEPRQQYKLSDGDNIGICEFSFTFRSFEKQLFESPELESSSKTAVLFDDALEGSPSTIMSKLDVSSDDGSVHFTATPQVKLDALMEIVRNLGKSVSLDQVLPQVLNSLFKIFLQADRGFIVLKNSSNELVRRLTKLRRDSSNETIRISRTIVNEAIDKQQAVLSKDAANDSRFDMAQSIADFRIRSVMCAPLINNEGEAIGVLQVDTNNQRNGFRQEDLEVLIAVATQAAIAIDNAQLHESALLQRELERDLELAREVQKSFLPERCPTFPGYEFFDYYQPANHIGGDYFDYILLPDGRLAIVVADVVGHGVAAALLTGKLSAAVRFSLVSETLVSKALTELNGSLAPETFDGRFVTLVMVVIDPKTQEATVVNAGHMAPLVRHANGELSEIGESETGLPLIIDADYEYRQHVSQIAPGDTFVLFTDGITEAMDTNSQLYGIERLRERISCSNPQKLGQEIVEDVKQFTGGRPATDDMCLVCFGRDEG